MIPKLALPFLAIVFASSLGACGGRRGGRDASVEQQTSFIRARSAQTTSATHCDCFTALGYPSASICEADVAPRPLDADQLACVDGMYVSWADSLNPRFFCLENAHIAFDTCMKAVTACDMAAVQSCQSTAGSAIQACPTLDPALQSSLTSCLTPSP